MRLLVLARANYFCEYCWAPMRIGSDLFAIEHIVPEVLGGATHPDNLALACSGCNLYKGAAVSALDPLTGHGAPLFDPRRQLWSEHFQWSEDFQRIMGTTRVGRATVERLRMNRSAMAELREMLHAFHRHPPPGSLAVGPGNEG